MNVWENIMALFRAKTPLELAQAELLEAQRNLLMSMSGKEHAEASSLYHAQRIDRLRAYIKSEMDDANNGSARMQQLQGRQMSDARGLRDVD